MVKEELILWDEYPCGANSQIYSHFTKKYLKGNVAKDGYIQVMLKCVDGKYRMFQWHRVIYTYFYGTIPEGMQVNHINEDKADNRLCNLNLMTPKENTNWGTRTERCAAKRRGVPNPKVSEKQKGVPKPYMIERNKKLFSKPVVAVDKEGNVIYEFASVREAGRNGFHYVSVSACCNNCYIRNGNRFFKGYYWYFKEDYLKMKGVI